MIPKTVFFLWLIALPIQLKKHQIIDVIDGDSIVISRKPWQEIRLLEVDCPELDLTWWSAKEAKNYTSQFIGKTIYVEKDISDTDSNKRLLRHVYVEEDNYYIWLNKVLIEKRLCEPKHFFPDYKYREYFDSL